MLSLIAAFGCGYPILSTLGTYVPNQALEVHLFSKHLQFLDYDSMAKAVRNMGFDGVELTVRPKGHVIPERVEEDLPLAVAAIRKQGVLCKMMVTNITGVDTPYGQKVLETASKLGITHYRMGYYRYGNISDLPSALNSFNQKAKQLSRLNKKLGLIGMYQNHAGQYVGSSIWEIWQLLKGVNTNHLGCQYDIRHAVVEGGQSWGNGLKLIHPNIQSMVIKDFKWQQIAGKWKLLNTPLGEGMVDFDAYFKLLKKYQIKVPISLHYEYPLAGTEHGTKQLEETARDQVYRQMEKDLLWLRKAWKNA